MKATIISVIVATLFIGSGVIFARTRNTTVPEAVIVDNVTVVDGKQIIEISAKGGFTPEKSLAKAGIPTVIRFSTKGTFDCSSSVRIPSMNISQALPQTGSTDIDIGTQQVAILQGTCGMGMYPFEIEFES